MSELNRQIYKPNVLKFYNSLKFNKVKVMEQQNRRK